MSKLRPPTDLEDRSSDDVSPRLTYADYVLFPDDGQRHEVIDGRHFVSPSPRSYHQLLLVRLVLALGPPVQAVGGRLYIAPLDLRLSEHDILQPDLFAIRRERLAIVKEKWVETWPDLVAEILSPSTKARDLGLKKERYALGGVTEYLVVDPEAKSVEQFVLEEGELRSRGSFVDRLCSESFEVEVELVSIW